MAGSDEPSPQKPPGPNRRDLLVTAGTAAALGAGAGSAAAETRAPMPADFASQAEARGQGLREGETSAPNPAFFRTAGRERAGDGGAALFVRARAEPGHPGKLRTPDGAWWEQVPETGGQDYRAFGTGAGAINDAIAFLSQTGGGTVVIPAATTISAAIIARDNVTLKIPRGVTLALDTDLGRGAMIEGRNVPGFQVTGGGRIEPRGNALYAIRLSGPSGTPVDGIEITGHKGGIRIEAGPEGGVGAVTLRHIHLHDHFVHPTDPEGASEAGHGVSVSCRPALGYPMTESVVLENIRAEAPAPGTFSPTNQFTRDLISVQGAKTVHARGLVSLNSGEVGVTFSFGCQHVVLDSAHVEGADGHGIIMTGAHYLVVVDGIEGTFEIPDPRSGETVEGAASGATARIEYLTDRGDGTHAMWVHRPSRAKLVAGETITGAVSGARARIVSSWPARKLEVHPPVLTVGNGRDGAGRADYAGVMAQHVEEAYLAGTHRGNRPFGMKALNSGYRLGPHHCPIDGVQTAPLEELRSTFLGLQLGPVETAAPGSAEGAAVSNSGILVNGARQLEVAKAGDAGLLVNRTGAKGTEEGDAIRVARNGTVTAGLGTDGVLFPQNTGRAAFSHASLPDPKGVLRKINFSVSSRGGGPALVRSDGRRHVDLVSGLPSRATPWTRAGIEAEPGAIPGGTALVADGPGGPALAVWTGEAWRYLAPGPRAGTAELPGGADSVAVRFATPFAGTDYAVTLTPHGPDPVWITGKEAGGFTLRRAGVAGALAVDWTAVAHWGDTL